MNLEIYQKLCSESKILWTQHCLQRMQERDISRADVKNGIATGEIIEDYPEDYPNPSCLIFGYNVNGRILHIVAGCDNINIYIITAYYPDTKKFENDLRTGKIESSFSFEANDKILDYKNLLKDISKNNKLYIENEAKTGKVKIHLKGNSESLELAINKINKKLDTDLEVDKIKDIDTNKRSYEITRAISFFAKNVNIPCIAEFVHNESVQKFIKELGINYSQGYYFSQPNEKLLDN